MKRKEKRTEWNENKTKQTGMEWNIDALIFGRLDAWCLPISDGLMFDV